MPREGLAFGMGRSLSLLFNGLARAGSSWVPALRSHVPGESSPQSTDSRKGRGGSYRSGRTAEW